MHHLLSYVSRYRCTSMRSKWQPMAKQVHINAYICEHVHLFVYLCLKTTIYYAHISICTYASKHRPYILYTTIYEIDRYVGLYMCIYIYVHMYMYQLQHTYRRPFVESVLHVCFSVQTMTNIDWHPHIPSWKPREFDGALLRSRWASPPTTCLQNSGVETQWCL